MMQADIVIQVQGFRSFRWGNKDGWKRVSADGVIAVKLGGLTAWIRDWKAVDGKYGTQTRIELELYGTDYVLWVKGNICEQLDAKGAGVWKLESVVDPIHAGFLRLQFYKLSEDTPLDPGVLSILFPGE